MHPQHHRLLLYSLLAMVIGIALASGGYWAFWNYFLKYRPTTLVKSQGDIQRLLDEADWVSPGRGGSRGGRGRSLTRAGASVVAEAARVLARDIRRSALR